ncbi:hypothetical protein HETIRDRAFT_234329, partial [Heterobasidion irregulare TC 32-1]
MRADDKMAVIPMLATSHAVYSRSSSIVPTTMPLFVVPVSSSANLYAFVNVYACSVHRRPVLSHLIVQG